MRSKKKEFKSLQHLQLRQEIQYLKKCNKQLKQRIQSLEDAIHQVYVSKKKYKVKYKQVKQKLQILQFIQPKQHRKIGQKTNYNNHIQLDENYLTHQLKRIKSTKHNNQDDVISLTLPTTHSNAKQQNQSQDQDQKLSKYLIQNKNLVAGKIIRSSKAVQKKNEQQNSEIRQIKQSLYDVKNQLQKFIFQLDKSQVINQNQKGSYNQKSLQQRLSQICLRLQRIENIQKQQIDFRTSALKSKSSSGKTKIKSGQFLKTIQDIGRDLTEWKIGFI